MVLKLFKQETDPGQMTEQEWSIRERWMRELLDASNDGFWEWNVATGHVHFSGRWAEMLGYQQAEVEPHVKTWEKLVHPEDLPGVMSVLQEHLAGRLPYYQTEHRLKCRDGSWRWILDRGRVVERAPDGSPLRAAGAHIDITEKKRVEEEKEELSRSRQEILGVVSHELKNPIHAILSGVEVLRIQEKSRMAGLSPRPLDLGNLLKSMLRAVRRMDELVNDLLLVTRLESGVPVLQLDQPRVDAPIEESLESVSKSAASKNLALEVHVDPEIGKRKLAAEGGRLRQILVNLLENAIRFSPIGGALRVSAIPENNYLRFCVEDSGPGVRPEDRAQVFKKFWQARQVAYKGTGLGLYISDALVRAHQGSWEVGDSDLGGARFSFTIPFDAGTAIKSHAAAGSTPPIGERPSRAGSG